MLITYNHGIVATKAYQVWRVGSGDRWIVLHHSGKKADCQAGDARTGVIQASMEFTGEMAAIDACQSQVDKKRKSSKYNFKGWQVMPPPTGGKTASMKLTQVFGAARGQAIFEFIKSELGLFVPAIEPAFVADSTSNPEWGSW